MWLWFDQLRSHPITVSIVTALLLASAFAIGALLELGLAFVTMVDKSNLTLLIAFYGTAILFVLNLLRLLVQFVRKYQAPVMNVNFAELRRSLLGQAPLPRWLPFIFYPLMCILVLVGLLPLGWSISSIPMPEQNALLFVGGSLALATAGFLTWLALLREQATPAVDAAKGGILAFVNGWVLLATFHLGSAWIEHQRTHGPWLTLIDSSGNSRIGTVVMPASDGFIVFYRGDKGTYYLPHTDVRGAHSFVEPRQ